MAGPMRKDMWAVHLTVDGIDWGGQNIWDTKTGGEVDSSATTYSPGGMEKEVALGGKQLTGNVTLTRLYRQERDHLRLQKLMNAAGKASCKILQQPLDEDGNASPTLPPLVYTGKLKRVTPPDVDSTTQDTPALIEVEVTIEGTPHVG